MSNKPYLMISGRKYFLQTEEDGPKTRPGGDPRYSEGTPADERADANQSTRQTVEGIYEMLKTILSKIDQNMPYISRACEKDGGE